jgi:hypothetical protein
VSSIFNLAISSAIFFAVASALYLKEGGLREAKGRWEEEEER